MGSGKYDKRAAIQTRSGTPDAGGNITPVWTTAVTRWASLEDTNGRELYRAQKVDATVDAVVTLRTQYPGLTPKERVIIDGRTFSIKSVLGASDRTTQRGQIVHCKEVL